jgi:lysophospholipase L1-like esterase
MKVRLVRHSIKRSFAIIATAYAAATGNVAIAQPAATPGSVDPCATIPLASPLDMALMSQLMLEPHKFATLADLIRTLPPEAMSKIATMQTTAAERQAKDWPGLCRYVAENAQVSASGKRPKIIFLGDSITENWKLGDPSLFGQTVLDRGISGQTTPQILLRFYQDVVALRPRTVHIMAGVNDIMGNTGPTTDATIVNNIRAMIDIANTNNIRVVLAAITPSKRFVARPELSLAARISAVNILLANLAKSRKIIWVDYAAVLGNGDGGLKDTLGNDGLHPNRDGYAAMRPLAEAAIARASR